MFVLHKQKKEEENTEKQAYLSQDVIEDIKNPFHQKFMSRLLPVICSVGFCHAILTPVTPFKIIGEKGSYLLKSSEAVSCIDLNDFKKISFYINNLQLSIRIGFSAARRARTNDVKTFSGKIRKVYSLSNKVQRGLISKATRLA